MVRVEVKNFQSIAHEVVEVDGFSALVGRSNIGKSAVVRAIKAALTGAPSDNYVRHDELCLRLVKGTKTCKCFCSVRIQGDDLDLLWEKGDAVNRYVHNTVEHTVVGRGTPDFLTDGFSLVKIGDDKELLQVSDQFNPIFILNKSGTVVADVLSDVAKLDEINVAMRYVETDRKEAVATRKVRDKDILGLRTSLLQYDGFDDVLVRVAEVEGLDLKAEEATQRLAKLEAFVESAIGAARRIKSLDQVGAIVVPAIEELTTTGSKYTQLTELETALRESVTVVQRLMPSERLTLPDVPAVVQSGATLLRLTQLNDEHADRSSAYHGLEGIENVSIPAIQDFVQRSASYQKLVGWAGKMDGARAFFDRTQKVSDAEPPELAGLLAAHTHFVRIHSLHARASGAVKASTELKAALDAATQAEAAVKAEFEALGVCPTCNREFAVDHPQHGAA